MRAPVWSLSVIRRDGTTATPRLLSSRSDWDIGRKVVSGGRFTTVGDLGNLVGAQVIRQVTLDDGRQIHLGRFTVTAADPVYKRSGVEWTVEWMDDAARLDRERLLSPIGLAATTPAVPRVRARLRDAGIVAAIADNSSTIRTAMAWTDDQTRLDEANGLLAAVGFHALWPTPNGLQSGPHIDPRTAPIAHRFVEGEESLHIPEYPQQQDHLTIPNRLKATSKGDGKSAALHAIARDVATSPWSYEARGYWVDAPAVSSDAITQAALVDDVGRRLRELQMDAVTMTIRHMWTPDITPGCAIEVVADRPEVSGRWQAVSSEMDEVATDALASTTLRKVVIADA